MSMSAIGGPRPQAYTTPMVNQAATERPGEIENDGDSDDGTRVAAAAARDIRSAVAAGVGRVIDQMA